MSNDELLDTVRGTDLCNQLSDLGVPVASITTNDKERVLDTLGDGEENRGDEGLGVVVLLKDLDLLTKTRAVNMTKLACVLPRLRSSYGLIESFVRSRLLVLERLEFYSLDAHGEMCN